MNPLKCYLILISLILGACSSPNKTFSPWDNHLSTEQNIAKNAIALESNEDFSFLDKIIRNRSVLILGEEGHYDYSTSEVKMKMINYLQSKGFHSIALEGAPFLTAYVFSNPKYAGLTQKWEMKSMWGLPDLRHKIYSLAFASLPNETDRGNFEVEIAKATGNAPYAFIDFETLRFADGYRDQAFESNVIVKKQGKWLYIFDGLYYIRDLDRWGYDHSK